MLEFVLNDKVIKTDKPGGMTVLDFVRYHRHLTGTKIGCREGDCGACTVLIGELINGQVKYQSMTSCITPLINASGKHVVTIEGLNMEDLSPAQQSMVDCGGTQCGFCTVGFVVSLSGYCMQYEEPNNDSGIGAIDGNICRCTGYKSIERATAELTEKLKGKDIKNPIKWLIKKQFIPSYFETIPEKLATLNKISLPTNGKESGTPRVGGGTDLYVQRPEDLMTRNVQGYFDRQELKSIVVSDSTCSVGASVTVSDIFNSEDFNQLFPNLKQHLKLVSSTQIRNMGTVAGNFVNASPIGDMTIFFLALDSTLILMNKDKTKRRVKLKDFYLAYKTLDLKEGESVKSVEFEIPNSDTFFNFEKVSKRTNLDIASVNSALSLELAGNRIENIHVAAGGVGPTPLYLSHTCEYLKGKDLNVENVYSACERLSEDISPIGDVRGSKAYKSLLLRQLFLAHFIELFPAKFEMEAFA